MKRKIIGKIMIGACTLAIVGCLGGCNNPETKGKTKETVKEQTDTETTETKGKTKETVTEQTETATKKAKGKAKETVKEQTDTATSETKGKAKEPVKDQTDTATTKANGNSSSNTEKNSKPSSTATSDNNTSTGSESNNSTTTTPATPETPKPHEHNWQPVYTTVHHDAVTHTEQQDQGHNETSSYWVTITSDGKEFTDSQECKDYMFDMLDQGVELTCGNVSRETTTWIPNVVTVTVVDTPAYDEQVISGYTCSCGATK